MLVPCHDIKNFSLCKIVTLTFLPCCCCMSGCKSCHQTKMSRPSDQEFIDWTDTDDNASRIRNALEIYPDLLNIRDEV